MHYSGIGNCNGAGMCLQQTSAIKKVPCEPFGILKYLIYRSGLITIFVVYPKIVVVCQKMVNIIEKVCYTKIQNSMRRSSP